MFILLEEFLQVDQLLLRVVAELLLDQLLMIVAFMQVIVYQFDGLLRILLNQFAHIILDPFDQLFNRLVT